MNPRQTQILRLIIDEYVKTAEPVSSKQLCERYNLACSSATVRNDMAVLEELGYIAQPHTSAGRVPTEKAYRFYIQEQRAPAARAPVHIHITIRKAQPVAMTAEERLTHVGSALAQAADEAVMLATSRPWSTTVGVANLLRKPEFGSQEAIRDLASTLERFDVAYQDLLQRAPDNVTVLLGDESPFGEGISSIVVRLRLPNNVRGVMGLVGPLRMDYLKNMALINKAKRMLEQTPV